MLNMISAQAISPVSPQPLHELVTEVFNRTFSGYNTRLVGGYSEPFYKSALNGSHALICFREDFISSALHEVAHWCIAGKERRGQDDFGYWYLPDGRDEHQQREFESVEIKPQALEWLFSLAAGVPFRISVDNLSLTSSVSDRFRDSIYNQAREYLSDDLPLRAKLFVRALCVATNSPKPDLQSIRIEDLFL